MVNHRMRMSDDDEEKQRASFDDIEVGEVLGEMSWTVTEEMIDMQCEMDADFHPWFALESPWGARVAPPQISYRPPRWLLSRKHNVQGLFYEWEMENLAPIRPGVRLQITATIVDKFVKNELEFIVYQAEAVDPDGTAVFRTRRTHVLDASKRAPRTKGAAGPRGGRH